MVKELSYTQMGVNMKDIFSMESIKVSEHTDKYPVTFGLDGGGITTNMVKVKKLNQIKIESYVIGKTTKSMDLDSSLDLVKNQLNASFIKAYRSQMLIKTNAVMIKLG